MKADYNNFEKARILLKYQWEGGNLKEFMDYRLPVRFYTIFEDEFNEVSKLKSYKKKLAMLENGTAPAWVYERLKKVGLHP